MILEICFNWLKERLTRKKHCEHEWKKTAFVYSEWRGLIGINSFKDTWRCNKCNKKEKRDQKDSFIQYIPFR